MKWNSNQPTYLHVFIIWNIYQHHQDLHEFSRHSFWWMWMMWMVTGPQDDLFHRQYSTFSFYSPNLPLPLGNYSTSNYGFFLQNLMIFFPLLDIYAYICKNHLCKHVCIKTWLNINQCKNKMIHTCHKQF